MRCPFCDDGESQVLDSRLSEAGDSVSRRRRCRVCDRRFTTYERYDQGPLYIRKRDGGREPFDRAKLLAGLERAAIKRPIERDQLEAVVDRIVAEVRSTRWCADRGRGRRAGPSWPSLPGPGRLCALRLRVPQVRRRGGVRGGAGAARAEPPLQEEHLFEDPAESVSPPGSVRTEDHNALLPPEPGGKRAESGLVGVTGGNSDSRRGS